MRYEIKGGFVFLNKTEGFSEYSRNGFTLGLGTVCPIDSSFSLSINTSFSRFSSDISRPETNTLSVIGWRTITEADPVHIHDISTGIRTIAPNEYIGSFIELRIGVQFAQYGDIRTTQWTDTYNSTYYVEKIDHSPVLFWSFGFALKCSQKSYANFFLEGNYTRTFNGNITRIPIMLGMQFNL
jgi:hypothetical protein